MFVHRRRGIVQDLQYRAGPEGAAPCRTCGQGLPHNVWNEDRTEADGPHAWLVDADAHVRSLAVLLRLCFWTIVQSCLLEPFPSMPLSLRRLPSCACGVQVRMYEAERDFVNGYGILFQDSIGKQASVAFRPPFSSACHSHLCTR